MLVIACLSALAWSPKTITLDEIAPVANVLRDISPPDRHLSASKVLGNPVVWIKARDKTLEEVREALADALSAEWVGDTLTRKKALEDSIGASDREILSKEIGAQLNLLKPPELNPADQARKLAEQISEMMEKPPGLVSPRGPADVLLAQLLVDLGPERLAKLPYFHVLLYSNRPTVAETVLPGAAEAAIKHYSDTEREMARLVTDIAKDQWSRYQYNRIGAALRSTQPVGRVLIGTMRTDTALFANLSTYSEDGSRRSWASTSFSFTPVPDPSNLIDKGKSPLLEKHEPTWEELLEPVALEPLDDVAGPYLRATEKDLGANIVMPLPDRLVSRWDQEPPRSENDVMRGLEAEGLKLSRDGEWTTGRYLLPSTLDSVNIPREALRDWCSQTTLENFVRPTAVLYARGGNSIMTSNLDNWYRDTVFPRAKGVELPEPTLPRFVLFYLGGLSDDSWKRLDGGSPLSLGSANASQPLFEWTKDSALSLTYRQDGVQDVFRTGSAAFPTGLPPSGVIVKSSMEEMFVRSSAFKGHWVPMWAFAQILAADSPHSSGKEIVANATAEYELGRNPGMTFTVYPTEGCSISAEQLGGVFQPTGVSGLLSQWPADDRDKLVKMVDDVLAGKSAGSRNIPPP